jgi:Fur family zinc uptake transcriptional regulator
MKAARARKRNPVLRGFASLSHEHALCVADALRAAEARCERNGERLTDLRRRVLELVWASHEPVKAYDLLDKLRDDRTRVAPPTVYRALEFLQQLGLVHKIESLNSFVGCGEPERTHSGQFLICQRCGTVAELDDAELSIRIAQGAQRLGFQVNRETIEVLGLCGDCRAL